MTTQASKEWTPPFCANEIDEVTCPVCGGRAVRVREKERYFDGDVVEAYCADCHSLLDVYASVGVVFGDPQVVTRVDGRAFNRNQNGKG